MSTARSAFTEAIEDHLALKKQNATIELAMPLARYDVGDPLDRYPGGPNRGADDTVVVAQDLDAAPADADADAGAPSASHSAQAFTGGPSPEQAMEAATALEHAFADRPFEPLNGLAPMLSLVEDIDEDDAIVASAPGATAQPSGDVLRFPGGVGPRDEIADEQQSLIDDDDDAQQFETHSFGAAPYQPVAPEADAGIVEHDAPTGEQPVLVIDTDEPLATSEWCDEPAAPVRTPRSGKPRFFGLGRKKSRGKDAADGWFTDGPRDFNWD